MPGPTKAKLRADKQRAKQNNKKAAQQVAEMNKRAKENWEKRVETAQASCVNCREGHADYPCNLLASGNENGKGKYRGGSYGQTTKSGIESNHAPANSSYPKDVLSKHRRPSFQMAPADHGNTATHGHMGNFGKQWRSKQNKLIKNDQLDKAFDMDAKDVMEMYPGKYDDAIQEAREYMECMKANGHV